jgi:hypothetical protein
VLHTGKYFSLSLRILYAARVIFPVSCLVYIRQRKRAMSGLNRTSSETVSDVLYGLLMLPFWLGTLLGVALLIQQVVV